MECEYCKQILKTQYSLKQHQKTAKYCLIKQNKNIPEDHVCNFCGNFFTLKSTLLSHLKICKSRNQDIQNELNIQDEKSRELLYVKKDLELSLLREKELIRNYEQREKELRFSYEKQIQSLQDKIENIAIKAIQKPTTVKNTHNNNYINKMQCISPEHLVECASTLNLEHLRKGALGCAEYALEGPLKDRVACVDYSRRIMKFKDKEGVVITDPEMARLAPMFFESIQDKSSELVFNLNTPNMDSVIFEEVAKFFNTNSDVKNCAAGVKTQFYHDFVKNVCSKSMVE